MRWLVRLLPEIEIFNHDLNAGRDDWPQIAAVDDLGSPGGSVPSRAVSSMLTSR
ncbi:MAG: hypothetical protein LBV34_06090 [Nocardiopsaceae bacterium]|jgi:hypothetical protein|nr:hypothetical protein [Nocardiopsaceae bacterium]